jgi:hypothetical protein
MYEIVSAPEILDLFTYLEHHTVGIKDSQKNPNLRMLNNLIFFMAEMKVSLWATILGWVGMDKRTTKERSHISIHEDHWIVKMIEIDRENKPNAGMKKLGIIGVNHL